MPYSTTGDGSTTLRVTIMDTGWRLFPEKRSASELNEPKSIGERSTYYPVGEKAGNYLG